MAKHRGEMHEEHTDESWLIPYADLLTLLLALFISLYASSNVDQEKYNAMAVAYHNVIIDNPVGMGPTRTTVDKSGPEDTDGEDALISEDDALAELKKELDKMLSEQNLNPQVSTTIDDRGLVITMSDAVLFDPGSAEIKGQYREVMVRIGATINKLNNFIRVEGHTDTVSVGHGIYPSNWELSGARASSVVQLFTGEAGISPTKLMTAGLGEFRPIADNDTVEGRSKNRRVDVILLSSRYNSLEEQRAE